MRNNMASSGTNVPVSLLSPTVVAQQLKRSQNSVPGVSIQVMSNSAPVAVTAPSIQDTSSPVHYVYKYKVKIINPITVSPSFQLYF